MAASQLSCGCIFLSERTRSIVDAPWLLAEPFDRESVVSIEMVVTVDVQSIVRSFSSVSPMCCASSCCVGTRPRVCSTSRLALRRLLTASCMCTGSRMVREWSAMAREIACRIHQVAYVDSRKPFDGSNFSAALMRPREPSWMRSCSVKPWFINFLAIDTTRRKLAETRSCLLFCILCISRTYSTAPPASLSLVAISSSVHGRSSSSLSDSRVCTH
mmetsp:Transcript_10222/g.20850  ORF Transcript_10222/g.20850 Transcript_10222/m.20850 type:complete len:216 (+) Transcript_10222:379-1026(+)